jgi:hypothetical protein
MGFYEDMIALIVVIVSLTMFFGSVGSVYATYYASVNNNRLSDEASQLLQAVRSYDALLVNGMYTAEPVEGTYSSLNLEAMTPEKFTNDIHTRFNTKYNVIIEDLEPKDPNGAQKSWGPFGEKKPTNVRMRSLSAAVAIQIELGIRHVGRLEISVWYA